MRAKPGIQVCAPIRHDLVLVEPSIVPMVTAGLMLIDQIMQFTSQTHKHTYKSMHTHTHIYITPQPQSVIQLNFATSLSKIFH